MNDKLRILQRQARRVSITLSYNVHEALIKRSDEEGRSVSNLCAFLLEDALKDQRYLIGIHDRDNIVDGLAVKKLILNGDSVSNGFSRRP